MKRIFQISILAFLMISLVNVAQAQEDKSKRPSPPAVAEGTIGDANIKIDYSSPAVKGRTVWGGIVPYGKIWRTGANEATTFETDKDITVEGKTLPAGRYSVFTIPSKEAWTIVFNSEADQWGSYRYNEENDVLRIQGKTSEADFTERLSFTVDASAVSILWENLSVTFNIGN